MILVTKYELRNHGIEARFTVNDLTIIFSISNDF